jgi:hypothetical protein
VARQKIKSEVSDFASMNPRDVKYVVNQLYQEWGACFSPYKDLFMRHTNSSRAGSAKPVG